MGHAQPADQQRPGHGQGRPPPLIARGYTDAPEGTAVVAGDPAGGSVLVELRSRTARRSRRTRSLAVLSNYARADVTLRMAEADLVKLKQMHDFVLKGTRLSEIALQEATLKSSIEQNKLDALQRARSGKPPDVREIETAIADQGLERQKVRLALLKTTLENDLAQYEIDMANTQSRIDSAKRTTARMRWCARRSTASSCRSFRARASACRRPASSRSSTWPSCACWPTSTSCMSAG